MLCLAIENRSDHEFSGAGKMLLKSKNAISYGAGGAVGGAVARVFAREGANVFLR